MSELLQPKPITIKGQDGKSCCRCKVFKPISEYGRDKNRLDGINGRCKECVRSAGKEYMRRARSSPEGLARLAEISRNWHARVRATPEGREWLNRVGRERHRAWRSTPDGLEKTRAEARRTKQRLRSTPEGRERSNANRREFDRRHPGRANAKAMARKATKLRACPPWADRKAIKRIYENCPPGLHVDHIHPLKGENFCGLHIPCNLQYLPAIENCRKGNRLAEAYHG